MDPLSIATAATALATFTFKASSAIYHCIDDVKSADDTLLQLKNEVDGLHAGLSSIVSTFESDEVAQLCAKTGGNSPQSTKLLISVKPLLADCEVTLDHLGTILYGIEGKAGQKGIFRKPVRAVKINFKVKDIEFIRHQIRSYSSAIQMTLQMVGMFVQVPHHLLYIIDLIVLDVFL
jgi:hypothetical protein